MIKKLTSKRGYVFTYEAIIIAFIFLSIFYIGYAVYSYNLLTGVEEKKNAEQYHKAILLKDFFIKSSSFPGKYYVDLYYRDFLNDLNIQEKTFDPLNNFSKFNGSVQFIINPNIYDDELSDYSNDLKTQVFKNLTLHLELKHSQFTLTYTTTLQQHLLFQYQEIISFTLQKTHIFQKLQVWVLEIILIFMDVRVITFTLK